MTVRYGHHDGYIRRSSRQRPDRERNRVRIEDVGQERTPPHNAGSLEPVARPAIMECAMSSAEIVPDIVTTRQADKSVADDWNAASRPKPRERNPHHARGHCSRLSGGTNDRHPGPKGGFDPWF